MPPGCWLAPDANANRLLTKPVSPFIPGAEEGRWGFVALQICPAFFRLSARMENATYPIKQFGRLC